MDEETTPFEWSLYQRDQDQDQEPGSGWSWTLLGVIGGVFRTKGLLCLVLYLPQRGCT